MDIKKVARVAIYPSIGIARIGNSPTEFFYGPTVPGQPATDSHDFRDKKGRIKRQATRFYVYGLDANGNVLGELNESHGVKVKWTVDVANKKAGWYNFDIALDIPAAEGAYDLDGNAQTDGLPVLSQKRNQEYSTNAERKLLMIEAKAQSITGKNKNPDGKKYQFVGKIGKQGTKVYLGELRTDEKGRLVFLGGRGNSASFNGKPLTTFANNEGWYDDTSDGPVDATVTLPDGRKLDAAGAWVLTAPTNYAVGVEAFTTGYDLLNNLFHQQNKNTKKRRPSFYKDIYPVLKHLTLNQWVNAGISQSFGWGAAYQFESATVIKRCMDKSEANRPFRQIVFDAFRDPTYSIMQSDAWPPLYGDAVTFNVASTDPRNWYAITELQYENLRAWSQGAFIVDKPTPKVPFEERSPSDQANGLTEAALEETLGGPFHPGCEFTWPMRHGIMYNKKEPFRIKRRKRAKEDFGVAISPKIVLSKGGPLDGSSPGDLTKWMAVPWQSDTSSCLSAYKSYGGEYMPTFWPARVPNDVFTEESYKLIKDTKVGNEIKIQAFGPASRKKWLRGYIYDEDGNVVPDKMVGVTKFVTDWYKVGILVKKPLDVNPNLFPKQVWVETGRQDKPKPPQLMTKGFAIQKRAVPRPTWVDENPRKHR